jgi:hypothetical protein
MDQISPPEQDAGLAFEALRGEVSLLRRAVEGLTAERQAMPDYAPTLAQLDADLKKIMDWARKVSERPGLRMTPASLAEELVIAGAKVRAGDHRAMDDAATRLEAQVARIDAMVVRNRLAAEQRRHVRWFAATGLALGILLWSFLPGSIARSLPASWHVPEMLAARMIGTPGSSGEIRRK